MGQPVFCGQNLFAESVMLKRKLSLQRVRIPNLPKNTLPRCGDWPTCSIRCRWVTAVILHRWG